MSQELIRLKKISDIRKKTLSIIKSTVYKKQLSVRFEDQKPIQTIKNLSQDIDQISHSIDSYFPLNSHDQHPSHHTSVSENPTNHTKYPSPFPSKSESSNEYNNYIYCKNQILKLLEKQSKNRINNSDLHASLEKSKITDEELNIYKKEPDRTETPNDMKVRNLINQSEAYGLDVKIVKKGRIFKPPERKTPTLMKIYPSKPQEEDRISPKIVKQNTPLRKQGKRLKMKIGKDVIISV
ncbi:hypothetical protein SteCoe_22187 [Stentor coeruleus]|uniref:Uncharacterized protein n=1 Tax=Stentor coeruleus TaxID=5963 RepID=A0A1R2BMT7_9CILI|nr:hypothetical protein SteCoe_22187 [Stentor coeruleus]